MVEKEKMFLHELIIPVQGMGKPELSIQEFERKKGGYKALYNLFCYTREWRFIIYSKKKLTIPEIRRFMASELMKVTFQLEEDL
jgi:hypothetical protein